LNANSPAGDPSKSWNSSTLDEVCDYIQRGKSPTYAESGSCKVVSQKCVRWNGFDPAPSRFIDVKSLDAYTQERYLKNGDLLWNSTGTGTVGRTAIFTNNNLDEKYVADSHVTVLRSTKLDPDFFYYWSRSPEIQNLVLNSTTGTTNQQELNLGKVKELTISFPSLEAQRTVAQRITTLFTLCDQLEREVQKSEDFADKFARSVVSASA
jgi:type I restriction enzyme S subunit